MITSLASHFCNEFVGEFRAWLVQAVFRAISERTQSSEQIPGKFRANSEQASQTFYFLVILCNESP